MVEVLEVFTTFTKYIQGNSYPTLNSLVLFYIEIKRNLEQLKENNTCEDIAKVIDILLGNLEQRFQFTDASVAAAVLDPATQHFPVITDWLQSKGIYRMFYIRSITKLLLILDYIYSQIYPEKNFFNEL